MTDSAVKVGSGVATSSQTPLKLPVHVYFRPSSPTYFFTVRVASYDISVWELREAMIKSSPAFDDGWGVDLQAHDTVLCHLPDHLHKEDESSAVAKVFADKEPRVDPSTLLSTFVVMRDGKECPPRFVLIGTPLRKKTLSETLCQHCSCISARLLYADFVAGKKRRYDGNEARNNDSFSKYAVAGAALLENFRSATATTTADGDRIIKFKENLPIIGEKVLFMRKRVLTLLRESLSGVFSDGTTTKQLALIIGTEGIGKTAFSLYLLYHLGVELRRPVVWCCREGTYFAAVAIDGDECHRYFKKVCQETLLQEGDILITDSLSPTPCALSNASHAIHVALPNPKQYCDLLNEYPNVPIYVIPTWNNAELSAFAPVCWPRHKVGYVLQAAAVVGGTLRNIRAALLHGRERLQRHVSKEDHKHCAVVEDDEVEAAALALVSHIPLCLSTDEVIESTRWITRPCNTERRLHCFLEYSVSENGKEVHVKPSTPVIEKALAAHLDDAYLHKLCKAANTKHDGNAFATLVRAFSAIKPSKKFHFKMKELHRSGPSSVLPEKPWVFGELVHSDNFITLFYSKSPIHFAPLPGFCSAIDGICASATSDDGCQELRLYSDKVEAAEILLTGVHNCDVSTQNRGAKDGIRYIHHELCPTAGEITVYLLRPTWAYGGLESGLPVHPNTLLLTERDGADVQHEWWFRSLNNTCDVKLRQVAVEIPLPF